MSRYTKLMVGAALLALTATAGAQARPRISNIQVSANATVTDSSPTALVKTTQGPSDTSVVASGKVGSALNGGSSYNSFVDVGGSAITFESSNAIGGSTVYSSQGSTVEFNFNNDTGRAVGFESTITPAGLGFYLAHVTGGSEGCAYQSCAEVVNSNLGDLLPNYDGNQIAEVGFAFSVIDHYMGVDNQLFAVSGKLGMELGDCTGDFCIYDTFGSYGGYDGPYYSPGSGAKGLLDGFVRSTNPNDLGILGYAWDATDIFATLDPGLHHITYSTSVYSQMSTDCLSGGVCLLAFSGFGDPIGRGGGADAEVDSLGLRAFSDGGPLTGINFTPETFNLPHYRDGVLTYNASGGVPEPATWAMLILGFGGIGATLRRRRVLGATI